MPVPILSSANLHQTYPTLIPREIEIGVTAIHVFPRGAGLCVNHFPRDDTKGTVDFWEEALCRGDVGRCRRRRMARWVRGAGDDFQAGGLRLEDLAFSLIRGKGRRTLTTARGRRGPCSLPPSRGPGRVSEWRGNTLMLRLRACRPVRR